MFIDLLSKKNFRYKIFASVWIFKNIRFNFSANNPLHTRAEAFFEIIQAVLRKKLPFHPGDAEAQILKLKKNIKIDYLVFNLRYTQVSFQF